MTYDTDTDIDIDTDLDTDAGKHTENDLGVMRVFVFGCVLTQGTDTYADTDTDTDTDLDSVIVTKTIQT